MGELLKNKMINGKIIFFTGKTLSEKKVDRDTRRRCYKTNR